MIEEPQSFKEIPHYPNEEEIYDFFEGDNIGLENARTNFKRNGMLYITFQKAEIARYASRLFYGYEDFQMMKNFIQSKQEDNAKISGFEIKTSESITDIGNSFVIDKIINTRSKLKIENVETHGNESVSVKYIYEHKTNGKMNLMNTHYRRGEFRVEKGKENDLKVVLFNHNKNEDYKQIEEAIKEIVDKSQKKMELVKLNISDFNIKNRINFIDRVIQNKYEEWKLVEVKTIRVKKPSDEDGENDFPNQTSSDEIEKKESLESAQKELLEGINDAVLKGHNLRTNKFVKECEEAGFYFPKVVMKMAHKEEPYKIDLSIQFKFRPIMPEIEIEETYMVIDGFDQSYILDKDFKTRTLNRFFHDILEIFNSFKQE